MALTEPTTREQAVTRQKWLTAATIGWNGAESVIAIAAGLAAGSVSLIGFGLDSGVEVSAALILAWRLAQERRTGCKQEADRLAQRLIAVSFAALAVYVGVESVRDLVLADRPGQSLVGIVMAALSLAAMSSAGQGQAEAGPAHGIAGRRGRGEPDHPVLADVGRSARGARRQRRAGLVGGPTRWPGCASPPPRPMRPSPPGGPTPLADTCCS